MLAIRFRPPGPLINGVFQLRKRRVMKFTDCLAVVLAVLPSATSAAAARPASASGYESWVIPILAVGFGFLMAYSRGEVLKSLSSSQARVKEQEETVRGLRMQLSEAQERLGRLSRQAESEIGDEVRKAKAAIDSTRKESLQKGYWDRMDTMDQTGPAEKEMASLKAQKDEMAGKIELSKAKYHAREIDEESLKRIVEGYNRELIDIESKMRQLEKK
jgi:hypothetical protein